MTKESEIGIIANPRAGKGFYSLAPVHELAVRRNVPMHTTNSIGAIAGTLRKLINECGVKVLMVYGGDGTLHRILDMLIYEHSLGRIKYIPQVLPMGGGTMRAVFHWLGWKEKPVEILNHALATPLDQFPVRKFRPLAITFANRDKGRVETHYGFMYVLGAVNRIIELYEQDNKSMVGGVKHILLGAMAGVTGVPKGHRAVMGQFKAEILANGRRLPQTTPFSVVASVCDDLLYGIKPFSKPAESNQFYALAYSVPAWVVSLLVPLEVRATLVPKGDRFFNDPVFTLKITPREENTFFLDGEHFNCVPGQPTKIELGPEVEFIPHF